MLQVERRLGGAWLVLGHEAPQPRTATRHISKRFMMSFQLPSAGAATDELAGAAHRWWCEAAAKSGLCLADFDPRAALCQRLAWAQTHGIQIGTVLSRYSSKLQHSTDSQIQECVEFAARTKMYVPPEYVCVDEAVSGRKSRRDGLDRVKAILRARLATV